MKNTTLLMIMVMFVVLIGIFLYTKTSAVTVITGNVVDNGNSKNSGESFGSGETQKITLGMKNFNYYPNTVNVKANQPVEVTIDESVFGCLRSFAIKELGVRKYAKTPSDKIIFTPTQKGVFTFSCSMGMGYGKLVVE